MSGWVRLHRGWRDSEFFSAYRDSPLSEREAWLWLIENAAWKDMERRNAKGEMMTVRRGQMLTSLRSLETAWLWNKNSIDRFLKRLAKYEMVALDSGQHGCLISIVNYCTYQSELNEECAPSGQPRDSRGTASGQSRDTQEEGIKKGEEGKKKKWALPESICADAWADWEQYRRDIKKPLTDHARRLSVGVLEQAAAAGFSNRETIDLAIMNRWQGLFVPKGKPNGGKDAAQSERDFWKTVL